MSSRCIRRQTRFYEHVKGVLSSLTFLIGLVFLVLLPFICIHFSLYQSVYYSIYTVLLDQLDNSAGSGFQPLGLIWGEEERRSWGDKETRKVDMMKELAAINAARVKKAKRVLKNLEYLARYREWEGGTEGEKQKLDNNTYEDNIKLFDNAEFAVHSLSQAPVPHISITIISSIRETYFDENFRYEPKYLLQNVVRLAELLSSRNKDSSSRTTFSLSICSVSGKLLTAEEQYLSRLFTVIRSPASRTIPGPHHDTMAWPYEKEKRDYVWCLRHAAHYFESAISGRSETPPSLSSSSTYPDYVMVLEDDVIALPEALNVIEQLVLRHDRHVRQHAARWSDDEERKGFYVKLYHPPRLQGYLSLERDRLPQLFALSTVLGSALYAVLQYLTITTSFFKKEWVASTYVADKTQYAGLKRVIPGEVSVTRTRNCFRCRCVPRRCYLVECLMRSIGRCYTCIPVCVLINRLWSSMWLRCCIIICVASLLIGRPHMDAPWRRALAPHLHYTVPDVHCCTQALLYSRPTALALSAYLERRVKCNETWHKDDAFWEFRQNYNKLDESESEGVWKEKDIVIGGDYEEIEISESNKNNENAPVTLMKPNYIGLNTREIIHTSTRHTVKAEEKWPQDKRRPALKRSLNDVHSRAPHLSTALLSNSSYLIRTLTEWMQDVSSSDSVSGVSAGKNVSLLRLREARARRDEIEATGDRFNILKSRKHTGSRQASIIQGYLVRPNLFQHIGLWSSLRRGFINPELILEY